MPSFEIISRPPIQQVNELLQLTGLNGSDITDGQLETFFGIRTGQGLAGVVGLAIFGRVALLRSLAVAPSRRGHGLGARLVAHAEAVAREHGVAALYLLTETAREYFAGRGYKIADRADAPAAIQATGQFSSLCPASAAFMKKNLPSGL